MSFHNIQILTVLLIAVDRKNPVHVLMYLVQNRESRQVRLNN